MIYAPHTASRTRAHADIQRNACDNNQQREAYCRGRGNYCMPTGTYTANQKSTSSRYEKKLLPARK